MDNHLTNEELARFVAVGAPLAVDAERALPEYVESKELMSVVLRVTP